MLSVKKNKVVVIFGPTGVGKTSTSILLAQLLDGEIISADSMQVYKGMDIGTAKVTNEEMQGIKHHMIDVCKPNKDWTVSDFVKMAKEKIAEIQARGKFPIIVGGTGLYIKALIENYDFSGVYKDEEIRKKYQKLVKENGNEYVYNLLMEKAPEKAQILHVNDTFRVIRALEILELTEKNQFPTHENVIEDDNEYLLFALTKDRNILYKRINSRVNKMFKLGLKQEVKGLIDAGYLPECPALQGIGYKELISYFNKEITLTEAKELIKKRSRNYAKRQLTFMRSFKNLTEIKACKQAPREIYKIVKSKLEEK